jgi:hypothetical protein
MWARVGTCTSERTASVASGEKRTAGCLEKVGATVPGLRAWQRADRTDRPSSGAVPCPPQPRTGVTRALSVGQIVAPGATLCRSVTT